MAERIYSVTQLTASIRRNLLANNAKLAGVWIEGEVSGNRVYASGHRYFTLKDKDAAISCVLFAFNLRTCDEDFKKALAQGEATVNGLKVQVMGELDLNASRGQYAFKVLRLRLRRDELGARMEAYNKLKATLRAEGLDRLDRPDRRRPLPFLPRGIGLVTSAAGAVIHDMCDVLWSRFPDYLPGRPWRADRGAPPPDDGPWARIPEAVLLHAGARVRLYPVKVQGDGAAREIANAIVYFNSLRARPDGGFVPDVLVVGRGGGSMEDLWAFNEAPVVYAVANSSIPVISAVGHESDFTLCDLVADCRAGTPSIGMARAVPEKAKLESARAALADRLGRALRHRVENRLQQVDDLAHRLGRAPEQALARAARRLEGLAARLAPALKDPVARLERRVQRAALGLAPAMRGAVQRADAETRRLDAKLGLLNPYQVLKRGYSITTDAAGRVVRAASGVRAGARLTTRLGEGSLASVVVREGEPA